MRCPVWLWSVGNGERVWRDVLRNPYFGAESLPLVIGVIFEVAHRRLCVVGVRASYVLGVPVLPLNVRSVEALIIVLLLGVQVLLVVVGIRVVHMRIGFSTARTKFLLDGPEPLSSGSYSSIFAVLAEPTGLFMGLLAVPGFACAVCLVWFAAAAASSLFWAWHSRAQWPGLQQWLQSPLRRLLPLPEKVPVVVRALSGACGVLRFLPFPWP